MWSFCFPSNQSLSRPGVNTFSPEGRLFQVIRNDRRLPAICCILLNVSLRLNMPLKQLSSAPPPSVSKLLRYYPILSCTTLSNPPYPIRKCLVFITHIKQGVVLAVEKRITSPLLESSSVEKIIEIDRSSALLVPYFFLLPRHTSSTAMSAAQCLV